MKLFNLFIKLTNLNTVIIKLFIMLYGFINPITFTTFFTFIVFTNTNYATIIKNTESTKSLDNSIDNNNTISKNYIDDATLLPFQTVMSKLKKLNLTGNEKILDIGCGEGTFTELLAYSVPTGKVVGVDISDPMIAAANKRLSESKLTNLSFIKQDAAKLEFTDEFDIVVSFNTFHWLQDHIATLKGIKQALKPGGKVFIYFAPDHGEDNFDKAIIEVTSQEKWSKYFIDLKSNFNPPSIPQFSQYLKEVKLSITKANMLFINEAFDTKNKFAKWLIGWLPHQQFLPLAKRSYFIDDVVDKYIELEKQVGDVGIVKENEAQESIQSKGKTVTELGTKTEKNKIRYYDYWIEIEAEN